MRNLYLFLFVALSVSLSAQAPLQLDKQHLLLDASLSNEEADRDPFVFNDIRKAVQQFSDTTTLYIKPWVYWVDNPDFPEVVKGEGGREPFGMVIYGKKLTLIGLGEQPEDVVLASQRGQMQGAVGNFTMFDIHAEELTVENMTLGNYCNVDLDYHRNPSLSRKKRSEAITQAHVGYVHGRKLTARRVRFISRLNLNPLNGAHESLYDSCHFECTDDALNGGLAIYRHCDFDLYGAKPLWSTFGCGPMFVDCDFYVRTQNRETYFCKQGGPVTVINCRYHAPEGSYLGWTAYPQRWLRCYQSNFTLNGKPYLIGSRQPQNTLSPAFLTADLHKVPFVAVSQREAALLTGRDTLRLSSDTPVRWMVEQGYEQYVALQDVSNGVVMVIPKNNTDDIVDFCLVAIADDGREAACHVTVMPSQLPPPTFLAMPHIVLSKRQAVLQYVLNTKVKDDDSHITWYRDSVPVATSHTEPECVYAIQEADKGHVLKAVIVPKQRRSHDGNPVTCQVSVKKAAQQHAIETDFHQFYCDWQPVIGEGLWTVDGYKPLDTDAYDWTFNRQKPVWEYGEGFNGAVGKGLLQAQRGARLMYTPVNREYNNMSLTLQVDPTKTAGQGFGSATGQYMDVCLKFDTRMLTGYGLRIIRTVKHAKAVDFLLVKYENGVVTPLTEPVSSTCYRTGCTINLSYVDGLLSAHVNTRTPKPTDSDLPHYVDLKVQVGANPYGGIHIQHTGSCGESTTMLHFLRADWK